MSHYRFYSSHAALLQNKPSSVSGEAPADVLSAAVAAADAIISSGAVSRRSNCDHFIAISGHSNPDHEPTAGASLDQIQITIGQKAEVPKLELVPDSQADGDVVEEVEEEEAPSEVDPDDSREPATASEPEVPATGGDGGEGTPAAAVTGEQNG